MADIALTDPLNRTVVLHDRTWYGHIVRGHPEMAPHRAAVEQAIRSPDQITHSLSDSDCRQYYALALSSGLRIVVVADVVLALVKTAYLAKKIKGGTVEWSRPSP